MLTCSLDLAEPPHLNPFPEEREVKDESLAALQCQGILKLAAQAGEGRAGRLSQLRGPANSGFPSDKANAFTLECGRGIPCWLGINPARIIVGEGENRDAGLDGHSLADIHLERLGCGLWG